MICLGAVVAALGAVNWWVIGLEPGSASVATDGVPADVAAQLALAARPDDERPLSEFGETVRRPLFTATRRPYVPPDPIQKAPEPAPAEPSRPPPNVRLIGVVIDAGKKRVLLRTPEQPRGRWVEEGDTVDGWLVRSVAADAAIVALGRETHELRLYPAPSSTPARQ
jgi:general secretion pathway protein N